LGSPASNIFVSNAYISFGQDLLKLTDDTFKLYTLDGNEYDKDNVGPRQIYSSWINKDNETSEFIGFSDGIVDEEYDEVAYLKTYDEEWKGASVVVAKEDGVIPDLKESL
jgi:hypothetical protein